MSWHAIYCESQRELYARDRLVERGYDTFCPCIRVDYRVPKSGHPGQFQRKSRLVALFPSYAFVRSVDFINITRTPGVLAFVAVAGTPLEVPNRVIDRLKLAQLRLRLSEAGQKPSSWFKGKEGDEFKFSDGSPLYGFKAQIASVADLDETGDIKAWVNMFGRDHLVTVSAEVVDLGDVDNVKQNAIPFRPQLAA